MWQRPWCRVRPVRSVVFLPLFVLGATLGCLEAPLSLEDPLPVADAGWDQVRYLGTDDTVVVDLDARASCDPVGAPLGPANWTVVQAPPSSAPTISNLGNLRALFEAATPGSYLIALTVSTDDRESDADFVLIEVREGEGDDVFIGPPDTDACGNGID
jgi:hypothetical protein